MTQDFDTPPDFDKGNGLLPAIVQHDRTEQVLMLGYMNAEALARTQDTGQVTFFSRSQGKLWTKGETSGNFLNLVRISLDCDQDTFLVRALPAGPTCHLGTPSCFGDGGPDGIGFLMKLAYIIKSRRDADASASYTAKLLQGPITKAAQKVGEEGVETALAVTAETDEDVLNESADLLYHLLVALEARNLDLADVMKTLIARHGD